MSTEKKGENGLTITLKNPPPDEDPSLIKLHEMILGYKPIEEGGIREYYVGLVVTNESGRDVEIVEYLLTYHHGEEAITHKGEDMPIIPQGKLWYVREKMRRLFSKKEDEKRTLGGRNRIKKGKSVASIVKIEVASRDVLYKITCKLVFKITYKLGNGEKVEIEEEVEFDRKDKKIIWYSAWWKFWRFVTEFSLFFFWTFWFITAFG